MRGTCRSLSDVTNDGINFDIQPCLLGNWKFGVQNYWNVPKWLSVHINGTSIAHDQETGWHYYMQIKTGDVSVPDWLRSHWKAPLWLTANKWWFNANNGRSVLGELLQGRGEACCHRVWHNILWSCSHSEMLLLIWSCCWLPFRKFPSPDIATQISFSPDCTEWDICTRTFPR